MNVKFIYALLIIVSVLLFNGCAKTPIPSLAGFVCSDQNKTLTPEELKQKEKRIKRLEKELDDTVGLGFDGHGFKFFEINVKTCRVYDLQWELTLQDWELLSEMVAENYYGRMPRYWNEKVYSWNFGNDRERHRAAAVRMLYAMRGDEAIAILECELNKRGAETAKRFEDFVVTQRKWRARLWQSVREEEKCELVSKIPKNH